MYLRPEQRELGKQQFQRAAEEGISRRQFVGGSLAAGLAAGTSLGAMYFGYSKVDNPVRVGVIGTGDEGNVLIGAHTPDYLQVVAIADIRPYNIHRAFHGDESSPTAMAVRPGLMAKYGWKTEDEARAKVKVYQDYQDLLKDPNVEAVIIALPLFLHDKAAIEAMQAGKHVLTEKLMAHSVKQCKDMGRASKLTQKILATGHQRHYSVLYDNAVDTIKRGLLGDLHHIRAQWHRGNLPGKDSWKPALPAELEQEMGKLKEGLASAKGKALDDLLKKKRLLENQLLDLVVDDKLAEKHGYVRKADGDRVVYSPLEELFRWRLWERTGGGLMAELGSHQLDAAGIFCSALRKDGKKARPLTVTAVGGRHIFPNDREIDDHVYCTYEFPGPDYDAKDPELANKKIVVTYSSINGNGFGGYGEIVMGTKGTLILETEQEALLFLDGASKTAMTASKESGATLDTSASGYAGAGASSKAVSRGYTEEMEHFAWCIRNFDFEVNKPKCHPEVALSDAVIALVSNVAIRQKQRIEFKPEWFDIDSDEVPPGGAAPPVA